MCDSINQYNWYEQVWEQPQLILGKHWIQLKGTHTPVDSREFSASLKYSAEVITQYVSQSMMENVFSSTH